MSRATLFVYVQVPEILSQSSGAGGLGAGGVNGPGGQSPKAGLQSLFILCCLSLVGTEVTLNTIDNTSYLGYCKRHGDRLPRTTHPTPANVACLQKLVQEG